MKKQKKTPRRYVDEFLKYKAAPDILGVLSPIQKCSKEISEAMAVIRRVKDIMLADPMNWTLVDLCSGNALVPALSAFTLPSAHNYAVDNKPRKRDWHFIRRFDYLKMNIYDQGTTDMIAALGKNVILTAVHACSNLARQVIQIYNNTGAAHLVLIPCCGSNKHKMNVCDNIRSRVGRDILWGMDLVSEIKSTTKKLSIDTGITSPRNLVITASRDLEGKRL